MKKHTDGTENGQLTNDESKQRRRSLPGINPDEVIYVSPRIVRENSSKVRRLPGHGERGVR